MGGRAFSRLCQHHEVLPRRQLLAHARHAVEPFVDREVAIERCVLVLQQLRPGRSGNSAARARDRRSARNSGISLKPSPKRSAPACFMASSFSTGVALTAPSSRSCTASEVLRAARVQLLRLLQHVFGQHHEHAVRHRQSSSGSWSKASMPGEESRCRAVLSARRRGRATRGSSSARCASHRTTSSCPGRWSGDSRRR